MDGSPPTSTRHSAQSKHNHDWGRTGKCYGSQGRPCQDLKCKKCFHCAVGCWWSCISARDISSLSKLSLQSWKRNWTELGDICVSERSKLFSIVDSLSHLLHDTLQKQQSFFSHRLTQPCCHWDCYRKILMAFTIYLNSSSQTDSHRHLCTTTIQMVLGTVYYGTIAQCYCELHAPC